MADPIIKEYHGQKIQFDEKREEWSVVFDYKEQFHKSLQIIKNYIDSRNKKAFERVPVFVQKQSDYYSNRGEGYEKAVITSVGVDETIFVVREGSKSAEHCGMAYVRNEKNASLIKEIAIAHSEKEKAVKKYEEARRKLKEVDFEALCKKALGERSRE